MNEYLTKLDCRVCAWDAIDGPLWLLVALDRSDGSLWWSWQLRANGGTARGCGGHARRWSEIDAQVEAGRLRAWELIRQGAIMEGANHDCREVAK